MSNIPTGTIIFDVVSKRYRLGALGSLRSTVESLLRNRQHNDNKRDFWALKDVSFRVEPGDSLGLIGPNGAGKTTVLKLLSNITQPTTGRIAISGRISSLIELGAGFHPELTGRENIFLNGAILGLSRREIQGKLEEIIAFSELERFIDTPVKRYSSGMYVRLGFAVAAHIEPEILLVDEVLAVGDAKFRSRCLQRIRELQGNGTTIVLVSHNMHQITQVCTSAILLSDGKITSQGTSSNVIARYNELISTSAVELARPSISADPTYATWDNLVRISVEVLPLSLSNENLSPHTAAKVCITYSSPVPIQIGRVHIATYKIDHTLCCVADSAMAGPELDLGGFELTGTGAIEATFEPLQLAPDQYYVIVKVTDSSDLAVIASCQSSVFNVVTNAAGDHSGVFVPNTSWRILTRSTLQ